MSMSGIIVENKVDYNSILKLCLWSEVHRHWFVKEIERLFIKPLEDDHARLFYKDSTFIILNFSFPAFTIHRHLYYYYHF